MTIRITGDDAADQVLTDDPFALVMGMLLDQQYPMEHAFRGPAKVLDRFGTLDPRRIAEADPEEFAALCATPPASRPMASIFWEWRSWTCKASISVFSRTRSEISRTIPTAHQPSS